MSSGSFKDNAGNRKEVRLIEGVGTTATDFDLGENYQYIESFELAAGGIRLTADDTAVTPVAGDDITVTGALQTDAEAPGPTAHRFNLGDSNAAVVIGLDENGVTTVTKTARYLQCTAAQVQSTETWSLWVTITYRNGG